MPQLSLRYTDKTLLELAASIGAENATYLFCDAILYVQKTTVLPRQARDKHREKHSKSRENSKKAYVLLLRRVAVRRDDGVLQRPAGRGGAFSILYTA